MVHAVLCALVALILGSSPVPSAYDIFNAARAQWQLETYPQYLTYVVETDVAGKNGSLVNDYQALCFCAKGDVRVDPISTEEARHPTTPHGISFRFNVTIGMGGGGQETTSKLLNPTPPPDPLGVPILSPLYSFGLRPEPVQTAQGQTNASNLPIIATTTTAAKNPYDVQLIDIETLDGETAYHLTLHAVMDVEKYRLRDLWIDTKTYDTLRAVVAENFAGAWYSATPWTIDFARKNGFQYIVDETADGSVSFGDRTYATAKILFKNVTLSEPGALGLPIDVDVPDALREPTD
ncbi:MAG TPA: hypothetical protein VF741_08510 [Candidatus Aquilonibacter sp.]